MDKTVFPEPYFPSINTRLFVLINSTISFKLIGYVSVLAKLESYEYDSKQSSTKASHT